MNTLALFVLALAVWREARGESMAGKSLVAQTIKNRVLDPRWPDTYVGVITQRWQFSAFNAGDPNALLFPAEDDPSWLDSLAVARAVMGNTAPITTANHYHTAAVNPSWAKPEFVVATEGHHIFYCL